MVEESKKGVLRRFLGERARPFVEITRKYRTPRIKMTRLVRISLILLRIYLIFIIAIFIIKFFTTV